MDASRWDVKKPEDQSREAMSTEGRSSWGTEHGGGPTIGGRERRGGEQPEREEERPKEVVSRLPRPERRERSTVPDGAERLGKRRELIHWT